MGLILQVRKYSLDESATAALALSTLETMKRIYDASQYTYSLIKIHAK